REKDGDLPKARANLDRLYTYYLMSWAFLVLIITLLLIGILF
ncbi:unnamed protein product, partial [Allacma fusca]